MAAIGFGIVAVASIQAALSAAAGFRALAAKPWSPSSLTSIVFGDRAR